MYKIVKRVFDLFLAIILLPIFVITYLLVFVFIKCDDKGPIFYNSKRIGKNGNIFSMYKYRTMKMDAPDLRMDDGSTFNSEDDPRVTKIGRFLRKTSIDEIPQLLNILKGDMSFIGPRPDSAIYLDKYTEEEKIILTVRPGITGYNQAINRNAVGTKEKLKNDIYYVNKMSLIFDLRIIFLTMKTVLSAKNIYRK